MSKIMLANRILNLKVFFDIINIWVSSVLSEVKISVLFLFY